MPTVTGQPVSAGPYQEMRSEIIGSTKQFKDVAFPVTDVHTAISVAESSCRLPQILNPAKAFLSSIGMRVKLTLLRLAVVFLNSLRLQNLMAASPSGSPCAVTARLECIRMPHCELGFSRPRR